VIRETGRRAELAIIINDNTSAQLLREAMKPVARQKIQVLEVCGLLID
jgi:hypothetical protein